MFPTPDLFISGGGEPALRWGIVGPGWIAGEFARAVSTHTRQRIIAVASRSEERGTAFATAHGIEDAVVGVEALLARPDIDVVYIATPQSDHASTALAAIAAGKHVLIEKPFTVTAAEAAAVADAARAAGVFVMEAMWTRYLPQTSVIRTLVADGALGEIHTVLADHGQAIPFGPEHRLFRPELGGGALLDLGIYAVQFASMVLGAPSVVTAHGVMTASGVDAAASVILGNAAGAQAVLHTTILARTPTTASIAGSSGTLALASAFYNPTTFTLTGTEHDAPVSTWEDPTGLSGFDALAWEATALAHYVGEGRTESPLHTLDETVQIISTIESARTQVTDGALVGTR